MTNHLELSASSPRVTKNHDDEQIVIVSKILGEDELKMDIIQKLLEPCERGTYGHLLGRPWLTTVVDTYSCCIMNINLGFDAPGSQLVALTLRHPILFKKAVNIN